MPKKHPSAKSKKQITPEKAIHAAALVVAAESPWVTSSYYDIAERAGVSVDEVFALYPTRADLVAALAREVDDAVIRRLNNGDDLRGDSKDKLFDIWMEKFDVMNDHRAAYISILNGFGWGARLSRAMLAASWESTSRLGGLAGLDAARLDDKIKLLALNAAMAWVTWVWMQDEEPDMARTMAQLDKTLTRLVALRDYIRATPEVRQRE